MVIHIGAAGNGRGYELTQINACGMAQWCLQPHEDARTGLPTNVVKSLSWALAKIH